MRLTSKRWLVLFAVFVASLTCSTSAAQTITAKQEDAKTIRVIVPGRFETTFTMRKGFGGEWFDLKHDPQKKRDMAPVLGENGFLWTKNGLPEGQKSGSWYANPPQKMELLEAGPVRVRVRVSGLHARYGGTGAKRQWKDLGFEQTFTIYPTGDVYIDYALVTEKPVPLHHFLLIIKSNGTWGKNGKGEGKGEVRIASEHGAVRPAGKNPSAFALQWSDGPTFFQDILMVMHKGKYSGTYWGGGYKDMDERTGLGILSRWPDKTVPKGKDHIRILMRFSDEMNSEKIAALHANDYRSPDKLDVTKGTLDKSDEGDRDGDGFNEEEGCYVLKAAADGVAFTMHGAKTPRMNPAFKVKDWKGQAPTTVTADSKKLAAGKEFNASVNDRVLLLQILSEVKDDTRIEVSRHRGQ